MEDSATTLLETDIALVEDPATTLLETDNAPVEPVDTLSEPDNSLAETGSTLTEPDTALVEDPMTTWLETDNSTMDPVDTLSETGSTLTAPDIAPVDDPTTTLQETDNAPVDTLTERNNALAETGSTLTETNNNLAETSSTLTEQDNALAETDNTLVPPVNSPGEPGKTLREPIEAIELSSPLGTVRNETVYLLTSLAQANKNSDSQQALTAISAIGSKLAVLANSAIVKSNKDLSNQVADALVKSIGVSADTHALIANLIEAESSTDEQYLESLLLSDSIYHDEQQQQSLVFGLASASIETRQSLQAYPQYESLLDQFKDSIRLTIQGGKFQLAARMTEIALLLNAEDTELLALAEHLSKPR